MLHSLICWLACKLTIVIHWPKAARVHSKYLITSQEKETFPAPGKAACEQTLWRAQQHRPQLHRGHAMQTEMGHQLGTKPFRQPQNSQLTLTTVENPIKIAKKLKDGCSRPNYRTITGQTIDQTVVLLQVYYRQTIVDQTDLPTSSPYSWVPISSCFGAKYSDLNHRTA